MRKINQLTRAENISVEGAPTLDHANLRGKRIVITTFGSFGDLHPYIALGLELKARGHLPAIVTSQIYREKIEAAGLGFHPMRPDLPPEEADEIIEKIMDVKKGGEVLFKEVIAPHIHESYEDLLEAARGADLLITHVITYAGPILAEKTGIPWISTVLAPSSFFSAYEPLVPPQMPGFVHLLRLSPVFGRTFVGLVRRVTNKWIEPIYKLREDLGLPRGPNPIIEGQHSRALVLALFSKFLGEPQPDWPRPTIVTGFPFYDKRDETSISPDLEKFLDEGPAPIVFTLGSSAFFVAGDFYRESIAAALSLKQRAVLLIGDERNKPKEPLPEGIAAFDYAPYSQILPRAAAIVHQGGVGTTGQALRAGVPTLIVPFNHDQPDNAFRVARLGTGRTLTRAKYKAETAARELKKLLTDSVYAEKAAAVGRQVRSEDGARNAADAIEDFIRVGNRG